MKSRCVGSTVDAPQMRADYISERRHLVLIPVMHKGECQICCVGRGIGGIFPVSFSIISFKYSPSFCVTEHVAALHEHTAAAAGSYQTVGNSMWHPLT